MKEFTAYIYIYFSFKAVGCSAIYILAASCLHQERTDKAIQMTQNFSLHIIKVSSIVLSNMSTVR